MTRESLLKLLSECRSSRERIIAVFAAADYVPIGAQIGNFTQDLNTCVYKHYTEEQINNEALAIYEQLLRWKFVDGQRGG